MNDTRAADLVQMVRAMWPGEEPADVLLGLALGLLPGRVVVVTDATDYAEAVDIGVVAAGGVAD